MAGRKHNFGSPAVIKSEEPPPPEETDCSTAAGPPTEQREDVIMSMLMHLGAGQAALLGRLDQIERTIGTMNTDMVHMDSKLNQMKESNETNHVDMKGVQSQLAQQVAKMSADLERVSHRTGCIKDLAVNTAAHTLNTARKVHGAPSLFEPVKHFKEGGYKDWSIRPISTATFMPQMMPTFSQMNPFNPYGTAGNSQMAPPSNHGNRTPVYAPHSPETNDRGNRTPAYGSRTPAYDGSRTPNFNRSDSEDFEVFNRTSGRTRPSAGRGGHERFQPYLQGQSRNQSRASSMRPGYDPVSPHFSKSNVIS